MAAFAQMTGGECHTWLRQKTRTTDTNIGEWTDATLTDYVNASIKEMTTTLLVTPWAPYFIKKQTELAVDPDVDLEVGSGGDAIKVGYVAFNTNGRVIPPMGLNRFIFETTYNNVISGVSDDYQGIPNDMTPYYVAHSDTSSKIQLKFYNVTGSPDLDIFYYAMPGTVTIDTSSVDKIMLPPIAYNAMLSYALLLCLEDERDSQTIAVVSGRNQREMAMVMASSPLSYDAPAGPSGIAMGGAS